VADLDTLLRDSQRGLLPYLLAQTGENYSRRIIRQYSFGAEPQRTGHRITQENADGRDPVVSATCVLEKMFDDIAGQNSDRAALTYIRTIRRLVAHWSKCVAIGLEREITSFQCPLLMPDTPVQTAQSTSPPARVIIAQCGFQIVYRD